MSNASARLNARVEIGTIIDGRPFGSYQWRIVALCFVIAMLDGLDAQAAAFVAPVVRNLMDISPQGIGNLYSAGLVGLMLGALTFGAIADRVGRKPVIILSCVMMGGFSLLAATATSLDQLLLFRFLTGLGLGAAMPNITALTGEYAPQRRQAILMTVMFAGFPVGGLLGGIISVPLIAARGWPAVFVLGGVIPLLLLPLLFAALPESLRFRATRNPRDPKIGATLQKIDPGFKPTADTTYALVEAGAPAGSNMPVVDLFTAGRTPGTLLIWIVFFGNLFMMYSLLAWLPTVMAQAGLGVAGGIYTAVAFNFGGVIGGLGIAWLLDRHSGYRTLGVGFLLAAVTVVLVGSLGQSLFWALVVVFFGGLLLMGGAFAMNAVTAAFYPTQVRSTGLGWAFAAGQVGAISGPILIGTALSNHLGVGLVFGLVAIPSVGCAIGIILLGRRMPGRRPEDQPALSSQRI